MTHIEIQTMYMIPVLLLAVDLLLAVLLIRGFLRLRRKQASGEQVTQEAGVFEEKVCKEQKEAYCLIEKSEKKPVYFTPDFEQITGIGTEKLMVDFQALREVMGERCYKQFCQSYLKEDARGELDVTYHPYGSEDTWVDFCVLRLEESSYDCFLFRDVTQEKNQVRELEEQLAQAQEASRSKTTFLSRMSHEIRTPINGIIGMLSLAHKQVEPGTVMDNYIQKAENLSAHLIALVNDILDMSRIEAGKIELENKPFSVSGFADKLRNMFQENIEAKGLRFAIEMVNVDVNYLLGDEFRLSQVIVNFLSNAVKFTSEGEITVTFRQMMKEDGMVDLMIRVHDTGIGMEPEFINRIFRPFEQENAEISKKYGGTGLGMAISDQIIRLMGGEIVIESMPQKGSDFIVYLHLPEAEGLEPGDSRQMEVPADYVDDYTFAGKHILLAEDNEVNAEIAVALLQSEGAMIDVAQNGEIAVEMFEKSAPGTYDFILMDVQMPVMDGREATRQIRGLDREDADTILIFALSADAFLEDERLSIDAGMDGHFAKPVAFDQVRQQIGRIVSIRKEGRK